MPSVTLPECPRYIAPPPTQLDRMFPSMLRPPVLTDVPSGFR
jgi:hypothetical protein